MIVEETYICNNCGLKFYSKYWEGGAIDHDNTISNIQIITNRFKKGISNKEEFIKDCSGLNKNICELEYASFDVAKQKFNCCKKYLEQNEKNLVNILNEETLKKIFNNIQKELLKELEEKSNEIKKNIVL